MNIVDVMLLICCVLGVVVMVIIAINEPRYTWRQIATFGELLADMQSSIDAFRVAIGEKLIPVFKNAIAAFGQFSDALDNSKQ